MVLGSYAQFMWEAEEEEDENEESKDISGSSQSPAVVAGFWGCFPVTMVDNMMLLTKIIAVEYSATLLPLTSTTKKKKKWNLNNNEIMSHIVL